MEKKVLEILKKSESLLEGHFLLSSGLHSDRYLQCAKVFQYPEYSEILCKYLSEKINKVEKIEAEKVISPAIGGLLIGYELSRQLGKVNIFAERDGNGKVALRRGFEIKDGEKILVAEDVVTTGGSVKEVIELVRSFGGKVVGVASIANRGKDENPFDIPFIYLVKLNFKTYQPENCPLCKRNIPFTKPGSRKINGKN